MDRVTHEHAALTSFISERGCVQAGGGKNAGQILKEFALFPFHDGYRHSNDTEK